MAIRVDCTARFNRNEFVKRRAKRVKERSSKIFLINTWIKLSTLIQWFTHDRPGFAHPSTSTAVFLLTAGNRSPSTLKSSIGWRSTVLLHLPISAASSIAIISRFPCSNNEKWVLILKAGIRDALRRWNPHLLRCIKPALPKMAVFNFLEYDWTGHKPSLNNTQPSCWWCGRRGQGGRVKCYITDPFKLFKHGCSSFTCFSVVKPKRELRQSAEGKTEKEEDAQEEEEEGNDKKHHRWGRSFLSSLSLSLPFFLLVFWNRISLSELVLSKLDLRNHSQSAMSLGLFSCQLFSPCHWFRSNWTCLSCCCCCCRYCVSPLARRPSLTVSSQTWDSIN